MFVFYSCLAHLNILNTRNSHLAQRAGTDLGIPTIYFGNRHIVIAGRIIQI